MKNALQIQRCEHGARVWFECGFCNPALPKLQVLVPEVVAELAPSTVKVMVARHPMTLAHDTHEVAAARTIAAIMDELQVPCDQFARVMLNRRLIPEAERADTLCRAGDTLIIRAIAADRKALGIVMQLAVVAAAAVGTFFGGPLVGALIMAGGSMLTQLALNALIAPPKPPDPKITSDPAAFTISGTQNLLAPYSPFARPYGQRRVFPMQSSSPYTESDGDNLYLRQLFIIGYGPLDITQVKLGDSLIDNYQDVEWELRAGYLDDAPPTLYSADFTEDDFSVLLAQAPGGAPTYTGWNQQTSGTNADELSVDVTFPSGLYTIGKGNGAHLWAALGIQIRYALTGTSHGVSGNDNWTMRPILRPQSSSGSQVIRSDRWQVATGQYDVQIQAVHAQVYKGDFTNFFEIDCYWTALRTIRDGQPYRMAGLAMIAVRIRSSHQLNGVIQNLNCVVTSVLPDFDPVTNSWDQRAGSWFYDWDNQGNGASAYSLDGITPHTPNGRTDSNWIQNESVAVANGSQKTFDYTLEKFPVTPASFSLTTGQIGLIDDGNGNLVVDSALYPNWGSGILYPIGSVVRYQPTGVVYQALRASTGASPPSSPIYWAVAITSGTINYGTQSTPGSIALTLGVAPAANASITASYIQEVYTPGYGKALVIATAAGTDGASVASKSMMCHQDHFDEETGELPSAPVYTVSGWYRASKAIPQGIRIRVAFSATEDFAVGQIYQSFDIVANGAATTSWQQFSGTVTLPASPSTTVDGASFYARIVAYHNPDSIGGVTVEFDDFIFMQSGGEQVKANFLPNPSFDTPGVLTRNPAAHFRDKIQGRSNKLNYEFPDSKLDLAGLQAWQQNCVANGYNCDLILDKKQGMFDALKLIASAGRASVTDDGAIYGVVMDLQQNAPTTHVTPQNSVKGSMKTSGAFPQLPQYLRVRFINPAKNWAQDERVVYADFFDASNSTLDEVLDLTDWCTDPVRAWKEGRYHLAQAYLRPWVYQAGLDWEALNSLRGDLVYYAHDVPQFGLGTSWIKSIALDASGDATGLTTEETFTFAFGNSYVARVRLSDGTSLLIDLANPASSAGEIVNSQALQFAAAIPKGQPQPCAGDLTLFGILDQESRQVLITKMQRNSDLITTLSMVDYVPAIYTADQGYIDAQGVVHQGVPPFDYGESQAPPIAAPTIVSAISDDTVLTTDADGNRRARVKVKLKLPLQQNSTMAGVRQLAGIKLEYRRNSLDQTTNSAAAYSATQNYVTDDTMTFTDGKVYKAFQNSTNQVPGNYDGSGNPYWVLLTNDEPWTEEPLLQPAAHVHARDVSIGQLVDLNVRYEMSDGSVTPWSSVSGHQVNTPLNVPEKGVMPGPYIATAAGPTTVGSGGTAYGTWAILESISSVEIFSTLSHLEVDAIGTLAVAGAQTPGDEVDVDVAYSTNGGTTWTEIEIHKLNATQTSLNISMNARNPILRSIKALGVNGAGLMFAVRAQAINGSGHGTLAATFSATTLRIEER